MKYALLTVLTACVHAGLAQQHCSTDEVMRAAQAADHGYARRLEAAAEATAGNVRTAFTDSCPKYIPVVVHILHNNGAENISDAQVYSQMTAIREDFRKVAGSRGDGDGVDALFEFFLAQKNPAGNATTGINRIQSTCTFGGSESCVKSTQWDPARYLNVWVVDQIDNGSDAYTYLPGVTPSIDGVLIRHGVLGTTGTATAPREYGHTFTHEAGHYLGLYHTFNSGCSGGTAATCALAGDKVCDTPPVSAAIWNCPGSSNTCSETPDLPDLVNNYMEYTDDACRNMFTQGQADRMHAQTQQYRAYLYSQGNLDSTGFTGNCTTSLTTGPEAVMRITAYPNPSDGRFLLTAVAPNPVRATLYDATGKMLLDVTFTRSEIIDLSTYPDGIYFVTLRSESYSGTAKVVVNR